MGGLVCEDNDHPLKTNSIMTKRKKYFADYYRQNRDRIRAKNTEYNSTPIGRAKNLLRSYRQSDKEYNRGECTLTEDYILEHIFTQPCAHCGETDWRKLGANRLDNNLPHTPSNVEPCCFSCNCELENPKKQVYQYTLGGLLVAIWPSACECGRNGFHQSAITNCCNGKLKTHKGYKWSYEPLQQACQLELKFE